MLNRPDDALIILIIINLLKALPRQETWIFIFYFPRTDPESDEYFDELFNIFLLREQPVRYVHSVAA